MSRGSAYPLRCCDRDCAAVNHCTEGGTPCEGCGLFFCDYELNDEGYCPDCADERKEEEDEP